jgi:hypothetical protein
LTPPEQQTLVSTWKRLLAVNEPACTWPAKVPARPLETARIVEEGDLS